jgi:Flp pilus assembly protein TadG
VTAEFAIALPAVVLVLAACLGAGHVVALQVRVQDAAAVAARHLARGDPSAARTLVSRLVPGASVTPSTRADLVCASVSARPRGLLSAVPVTATSCSLAEGG